MFRLTRKSCLTLYLPTFTPAAIMEEEDMEVVIKAVVVGNGAVGKSSMIQRYCNGVYTDGYKKTIGVDFLEKKME